SKGPLTPATQVETANQDAGVSPATARQGKNHTGIRFPVSPPPIRCKGKQYKDLERQGRAAAGGGARAGRGRTRRQQFTLEFTVSTGASCCGRSRFTCQGDCRACWPGTVATTGGRRLACPRAPARAPGSPT